MSTLVDIIVPVLNRPANAAPFMESLTTTDCRVVVVAELHDQPTITAWRSVLRRGDTMLISTTAHTFAEKVNFGYRLSASPWLLLVGDDARFTDDWLDEARPHMANELVSVIGTNDLANRRVINGAHTCHPLIRRSYVDTIGASDDGPRLVCHEGYRHNYVDDEIVTLAKRRGVWLHVPSCVILHKHPVWGTAQSDDTYRLGQRHIDADRALYRRRAAVWN